MDIKDAYNLWAHQYDINKNRTRDLEAIALKNSLSGIHFESCLEIGCGTGKNTEWFVTKTNQITAIDFSQEMLAKAKAKISSNKVQFYQADITEEWDFIKKQYDLVSFSLVLEHIESLEAIFRKTANVVADNGYIYIGELHPFKQYSGAKARFDTESGQQIVTCFNHHLSDFIGPALRNGFVLSYINEHFDDADRNTIPRILSILFRKA